MDEGLRLLYDEIAAGNPESFWVILAKSLMDAGHYGCAANIRMRGMHFH